jgi:hypothetical protein
MIGAIQDITKQKEELRLKLLETVIVQNQRLNNNY